MTRRPDSHSLCPGHLGRLALLLASAATLSACTSAPTRFFTLDPVAPTQASTTVYAGPPVKVLAVNIPPGLDREELVSETAPGEVRVRDLEHWAAPLGLTARQVLIQDLASRLPSGGVLGPASPGGDGVATLSVDIVALHAAPGGSLMQASWSASLPGGAAVFRAPLVTLQTSGASEGGAGTAQAFSALLGQLSDQIVAILPAQMQAMAARAAAKSAAMAPQTTTRSTVRATRLTSSSGPS